MKNIAELITFTDTLELKYQSQAHNLMNIAALIDITDTLKLKYQSMNTQPDEDIRAYCLHRYT